jgi:hypothetical protein
MGGAVRRGVPQGAFRLAATPETGVRVASRLAVPCRSAVCPGW